MEINNLEGRSRGSSFRRRALTLVGVSALTLSGVGAAVFGASQAFASTIPVQPFNIGTSVSNVTFSSNNTTTSGSAAYTIGFTITTALPSGDNITITGPSGGTLGTSGTLTDNTTSSGTQGVTLSSGSITTTAALNAGDSVSLLITGNTNPSTAGSYGVSVKTTTDPGLVSSNKISLTSVAAVAGSLSSQTPGASSVTMSVSNVTANALTAGSNYILLSDASPYNASPSETVTFPTTASSYTVTDTTTGATAQVSGTINTGSATSTDSDAKYVYFKSPISASAGDKITVAATGVINDSTAQAQTLQVLTLGTSVAVTSTSGAGTSTTPYFVGTTASGTSSFWSISANNSDAGGDVTSAATTLGTAVTSASISVSNSVAGQSNVTYTLGFTATSTATSVTVSGFTPGSTNILTNNTTNTTTSLTFTSGTASATITKGDSYTLSSYGVTNNSTSGSQNVTIHTSADNIPVTVSFSLSAASTVGPFVSLSSNATGASATWTFTGFKANAALTGGTDKIVIAGATGSTFPGASSDYTITDLTNSSGSGTASAVTTASGGATITLPNNVSANDNLELVVAGVINTTTGGQQSGVTLDTSPTSGELTGTAQVSTTPAATAPNAASTMASGSLVQTGGTIYVIAGGVAYGIPTFSDYQTISNGLGNPAVVQSSTAPTTTGTVASGTLVQVVGSPQINVVGSNNTYYGFSSVSQFESDGYNFANVIQIPSLGSLTAGSGAAPNAASTMASGSLVQTGGTIYVIAGGVAYGIPTFSDYQTISAALGNPTVVQSSTAPSTTGTPASGTLVQTVGSPQINVYTSTGTQVGFSTASEFTSDGYSFAKVVMIP